MKSKRFVVFLTVMFSFFVFLLTGCGDDGADGKAFLSINWLFDPLYFTDNNPSTPSQGVNGQYYQTSPGTYSFTYTAWDDSRWSGTYTITIDEGEEGGFLEDGEDGKDKYFALYCYSIGPSFYGQALEKELSKGLNAGLFESAKPTSMFKSGDLEDKSIINSSESDVIAIEKKQGRYSMRLEYQKVSIE